MTIVLLVLSIPLGLGMAFGLLASGYNYSRNVRYVDHLLSTRHFSKGGTIFYAMTSIVVMVIPFLLAYRFPTIINGITIALGLLWIKPIILLFEYREEKA